ncbi:MAG: SprT-like domain-containing protein [Chthoniobacterales bacterium]
MPARALQPGAPHPAEVLRQLQEEARAWTLRLELPQLAARVTLHWHARLRTTAGLARLDCAVILLNPRLLAFPEELTRTFLHELAHLVAHARNPRRLIDPHGPEWRLACADLGLPGEKRCHVLPLATPRRVERKHIYHCPQCRREVRRVRPFRRAEACLTCCRLHAHGRYDRRFRFAAGPAPLNGNTIAQAELFRL